MTRLTVRANLPIYEINDENSDHVGAGNELIVKAHWKQTGINGFVVLKLPKHVLARVNEQGDLEISVATDALREAVRRCSGF
jgi:hypothetical protein